MLQLEVNVPATTCPAKQPARWPFPPRKPVAPPRSIRSAVPLRRQRFRARAAAKPVEGISRMAMLTDICLVAAWGAAIPGLMWLGAAAGF